MKLTRALAERSYLAWLPWLSLVVSLSITFTIWQESKINSHAVNEAKFNYYMAEVVAHLQARMQAYTQIVQGTAGLFVASHNVDRNEFKAYVEDLHLAENYSGIQGMGFAKLLPAAKASQARRSSQQGVLETHTAIDYFEPSDWNNLRTRDDDMYSEPVLRAAMERAWLKGGIGLSGKVNLVQESNQRIQHGFLMFAPVYRNELPHVTEAHRRIALKGWVYSVFSARDLMHGLREEHYGEDKKSLDIEIYDGSEPRLDTLLFDSDNVNRTLAGTRTAHIAIKRIAIGGHVWTVMVYYLPVLEVRQDEQKRMAIAVSGIIISVMLALLLWMLINSRRRVLRLATAMNRDVLERERQLNEAQTVAQIGSWDWHVASTQVVCSKELCRLFGLETTGGSAALETFIELIHPEDRDRVKNAINAALYHKAPYDLEYRIPLPDGRMREVHAQGQVERSVDDEPLRIFGTLMDVTERNRVSREIEASERYQRALLEHLPVAVMVHGADGSMQYCNTLAIQLLGGDRQQLLAQGVDSAYWQFKREDGEDMPVGAYPVNLVLASKAPLHGYVAGIVHPDVKKTSWVLVNGFPYVDEAGQVRQVVVTFVDITALREAEDTLTQAMLELNELYEKSPSGYHSLDSESRIVKINQTELDWLGYHRNELLGKRFAELLSPSSQATFQGNYSQFMQRGYIRDLEYELVCRDGSIKMVLLSATAIYGTDGAFVMSRSTLYDISEIKRLF